MDSYQIALVVGLALAYLLYRIGRNIWATYRHADETELHDYWNGRLEKNDLQAYRRVRDHLVGCETCRDRLDAVRKTERREMDSVFKRKF